MKTSCCHSKHYKIENQSVVCTNWNCSNYLAQTGLLSKTAVKLFTASLIFCLILCFCKNDFSSVQHDHSILTAANLSKLKKLVPCTDVTLKQEIQERKIIC